MDNQLSYFSYYDRAIREQANGIKLVLGGTGLGKTSSIIGVIKHSDTNGRKFIYCANRLQLLNEMATKLSEEGIPFAYLHSNADIVINIIRTQHLRERLYTLIESTQFKRVVEQAVSGGLGWRQLDTARLRNACGIVDRIGENTGNIRGEMLEHLIEDQVRTIINFFRTLLQEIKLDTKTHKELLSQPIIQELFPYIRFAHDPQVRVLLVTIQKAHLGFFDGQENLNLTKFNGNNIIFLDEYDFLENELISLICRSEQITRPFRFVEFFYNTMARHKLPAIEYPALPGAKSELRNRLENIMKAVVTLQDEGIQFPNINQFTCQLEDKQGFVFQTSRSLIMDALYLRQTERSFEILRTHEDSNIHALRLFEAVRSAMSQIMFLFKELESQAPAIYQELLRQCYQDTTFYRVIGRITQLPRPHTFQTSRFDNLLEQGYGLYEITELNQETDPDEVDFNYLTIHTTPERILSSLAKNNMVFGLSATADIPRLVRNFNEDWLRKQNDVTYFDIDQTDIEIIAALNQAKQSARDNNIEVIRSKTLDDYKRNDIRDFILAIAKDHGFGGDDQRGVRRKRVESFFATLLWILDNRNEDELTQDTHLLFLSTFRQIKHVFDQHERLNGFLFDISPIDSGTLFNIYKLEFEEHHFIIVFYDANQAKHVQSSEQVRDVYDQLFWQGLPVITVTQYASAGNGVNLQYFLSKVDKSNDQSTDYRNIHLLEAPYFYFGRHDNNLTVQENTAIIKENIWYLAKLFEGQIISRNEFEKSLRSIHFDDLNTKYHYEWTTKRGDAIYNRLSALIQALGRVERVWQKMPDQTIVLSQDVWNIFQLFCSRPQYASIFEQRSPVISGNLKIIFSQIAKQSEIDEKWIRRYKEEGLAARNAKCKEKVGTLLGRVGAFRNGSGDLDAKTSWLRLRKAALTHDFHDPILKQYACIFKAEHNHYRNGILYVDDNLDVYPFDLPYGENIREWHLDAIYRHIVSNSMLRRHFEQQGFELGFSSVSRQFFTPYFYQAILMGAIGEVSIEAILSILNVELDNELPDELFEITDLKIANRAWYVDCKNYSDRTLDNFDVSPDDPAWRPKLNDEDFKQLASLKLATLKNVHAQQTKCKLIYLNLASSDDWQLNYRDGDFQKVRSFEDAEIIVVPGVLQHENPGQFTEAFQTFVDHLFQEINQRIPK